MSNLYTQLGYSTYEFTTASQLAALALFEATYKTLAFSMSVHSLEIYFQTTVRLWIGIVENICHWFFLCLYV